MEVANYGLWRMWEKSHSRLLTVLEPKDFFSGEIDAAVMCETWLKPQDYLGVLNYSYYRDDILTNRCGGAVILIESSIQSSRENSYATAYLEDAAISITV